MQSEKKKIPNEESKSFFVFKVAIMRTTTVAIIRDLLQYFKK